MNVVPLLVVIALVIVVVEIGPTILKKIMLDDGDLWLDVVAVDDVVAVQVVDIRVLQKLKG